MAWSVDDALAAADAFGPFQIGWYEEPLQAAMRDRYCELRERSGVRVMLDEAACSFDQTRAAIESRACDLINIRLSKCGGFLASLRLAELAASFGIEFQHGTQVGQLGFLNAAGRHFTSVVNGIVACEGGPGLANLRDFPTAAKIELDWNVGHLVGVSGAGIGAIPDASKVRTYSVKSAAWNGTRWH
jgi:L-Ala-D/L-Glu epimerase